MEEKQRDREATLETRPRETLGVGAATRSEEVAREPMRRAAARMAFEVAEDMAAIDCEANWLLRRRVCPKASVRNVGESERQLETIRRVWSQTELLVGNVETPRVTNAIGIVEPWKIGTDEQASRSNGRSTGATVTECTMLSKPRKSLTDVVVWGCWGSVAVVAAEIGGCGR